MLKKVFKIWSIVWGILASIGMVVALIVGLYSLGDRILPKPIVSPQVKEYIFGTNLYYVQVLTDNSGKVIAYGVTTRSKDFNPSFYILGDLFYVNQDNSLDKSKYVSGAKAIILGKTKFGEIGTPGNIFAYRGAHDFYYHEEYYYGNPGNYQSYFFSANESGELDIDNEDLSFFGNKLIDPHNQEVVKFRNNSKINTFYVTAPFEGRNNFELRKYLIGPDYYQTRVIANSAVSKVANKESEYNKLRMLSTNVDLGNIVDILGKPLIINEEPTFEIRTDKVEDYKFDEK